jgi:hypothetical protein
MRDSRIRLGHTPGEVAPNTWADFAWVHQHENKLLDQYGECVVLVYQQQVIGKGDTIGEAVAEAEKSISSDIEDVTPITYFLYHRHPFFRVYPDTA